jgi:hypothetical protein
MKGVLHWFAVGFVATTAALFPVLRSPAAETSLAPSMEPLLASIAEWLSATFELPAHTRQPRIQTAPRAQLAEIRLRLSGLSPRLNRPQGTQGSGEHDVEAFYAHWSGTIYLPSGWSESSAKDVSVLVHEMVHHLQSFAQESYDCPQERERLAYRAQERWLGRSGKSLESEFGLDPFSVFAKSLCH